MKFECTNPSCGQRIEAPDEWAGKSAPCPSCGQTLTIPVPVESPSVPLLAGSAISGVQPSSDMPTNGSVSLDFVVVRGRMLLYATKSGVAPTRDEIWSVLQQRDALPFAKEAFERAEFEIVSNPLEPMTQVALREAPGCNLLNDTTTAVSFAVLLEAFSRLHQNGVNNHGRAIHAIPVAPNCQRGQDTIFLFSIIWGSHIPPLLESNDGVVLCMVKEGSLPSPGDIAYSIRVAGILAPGITSFGSKPKLWTLDQVLQIPEIAKKTGFFLADVPEDPYQRMLCGAFLGSTAALNHTKGNPTAISTTVIWEHGKIGLSGSMWLIAFVAGGQ